MGVLSNLMSRRMIANKISRLMLKLRDKGERSLFVSEHDGDGLSNVLFCLAGDIDKENVDDEGYLQLRQVLQVLESALGETTNLRLKTKLERKKR